MIRKYLQSFRYAFEGITEAFRQEKHFRFHVLAILLVIAAGFGFQVSSTEWALLILCCGAVLGTELINASIERLADKIEPEKDPLIKKAKDLAAAAVLVASLTALIIGTIIFLPHLGK